MSRSWLLTWTTYGTWLPGDDRGFVSNIADTDGVARRINQPGSAPVARMRGLQLHAREIMHGQPIFLSRELAPILLRQFQETAAYRHWRLLAVAIMSNHVHILVDVPGDPEASSLLRDFKSYGSRALTKHAGKPASGAWWTEGGSTRKKADEDAIEAAYVYVMNQHRALLTWCNRIAPGER